MMRSLSTSAELDDALQLPLALVFKHSTSCAISSMAMREMRRLSEERPELPVFLLDVRATRPLSAELAERLEVRHESPQAILLRHGEAVWTGSHYQVMAERVTRELDASTV